MPEHVLSRPDTSRVPRGPLNWIYFPLALLYHELLLRAFDTTVTFFDAALLPIVLSALGGGLLLSLLANLLPWRKATRWAGLAVIFLWSVYVCIEYCCKSYFKSYFALTFMVTMTGHVVGDFAGTIPDVVLPRLPFILLAMLPVVGCVLLRRRIAPPQRMGWKPLLVLLALSLAFGGTGSVLAHGGMYKTSYTYGFNADAGVTHFGLNTTVRLEMTYALFGQPAPDIQVPEDDGGDDTAVTAPVVYGKNAMDIDFDALAENASSSAVANMSRYFGSLTPSSQNEYTGMFKGKNLILFTAEAFSPWFISEELTPALYRLTHEGFVCSNFYQPGWGQSTTGGEFAVMTGLIPTWVNGNVSFYATARNSMPFALGNQFRALGYTTAAYHDNIYNYYNRDKTHPNLGYDYQGQGSGLKLTEDGSWPYSDLEMLQNTIDPYIDAYVKDGTPFHTYYMTVSGHGGYGWGHAMAAKNRQKAQAAYPNASAQVQAYVAANLELESALAYLLEELETAGIADDTVICLAADHYPYLLSDTDTDYYNELRGVTDSERDTSRYRNALILWCGSMDEPVQVDEPCSAVDIVPTLSNLFGLTYDSRLLSGRDILDKSYNASSAAGSIPLVILPTAGGNSWATAAGVYEASTRTFTANPGITVGEEYVSAINDRVSLQYHYAQLLVTYDYYAIALPQEGHTPNAPQLAPPAPAEPENGEEGAETPSLYRSRARRDFSGGCTVPAPAMHPPGQAMPSSRYPSYLPVRARRSIWRHWFSPSAATVLTSISGCSRWITSFTALATPPPAAKPTPGALAS